MGVINKIKDLLKDVFSYKIKYPNLFSDVSEKYLNASNKYSVGDANPFADIENAFPSDNEYPDDPFGEIDELFELPDDDEDREEPDDEDIKDRVSDVEDTTSSKVIDTSEDSAVELPRLSQKELNTVINTLCADDLQWTYKFTGRRRRHKYGQGIDRERLLSILIAWNNGVDFVVHYKKHVFPDTIEYKELLMLNQKIKEEAILSTNWSFENMQKRHLRTPFKMALDEALYDAYEAHQSEFEQYANYIKDDIIASMERGGILNFNSPKKKTQQNRIAAGLAPFPGLYATGDFAKGLKIVFQPLGGVRKKGRRKSK